MARLNNTSITNGNGNDTRNNRQILFLSIALAVAVPLVGFFVASISTTKFGLGFGSWDICPFGFGALKNSGCRGEGKEKEISGSESVAEGREGLGFDSLNLGDEDNMGGGGDGFRSVAYFVNVSFEGGEGVCEGLFLGESRWNGWVKVAEEREWAMRGV